MQGQIYKFVIIVFLIAFGLPPASMHAESNDLFSIFSKVYSTRMGLPSNSVQCIFQDEHGYLWIGTQQGLVKYDGQEFIVYSDFNDDLSDYITNLLFDSDRNLWIGTMHGAGRLIGNTIKPVPIDSDSQRLEVDDIVQDGSHHYWLIANTRDLFIYKDTGFVKFNLSDELQGASLFDLEIGPDGILWMGTSRGLFKYDGDQFKLIPFTESPQPSFSEVLVDGADDCYVSDSLGVIHHFINGTWKSYNLLPSKYDLTVYDLAQSPSGEVWVCTSKGIFIIKAQKNEQLTVNNGLSSNLILSIYFDREYLIWYGSDNGLGKIFGHQFRQIRPRQGLPVGTVHDMDVDTQGNIWVGTAEGVIKITEHGNRIWSSQNGMSDDFVISILVRPDGSVFIGCGAGYYIISPNDELTFLEGYPPTVYAIENGPDGNVWIAAREGLYRYTEGHFESMNDSFNQPGLIDLTSIFFDRNGYLWVSTDGHGVFSTVEDGRFLLPVQGLPSESCFCFYEDHRGNIWIGTIEGACVFSDGKIDVIYSTKQGLRSNHIWSIQQDINENIWFATSKGLSCINEGRILNYDADDGLSGDDFIDNCVLMDNEGRLWFGGTGITIVDSTYSHPIVNPQVFIKSARINDRILYDGSKLDHSENNVEFSVVCTSYTNEQMNRYRFQLLGYDPHRSSERKSPHIRYTNLPTGDYIFVAEAMNREGVWTNIPATLDFEILPAWWEKWWTFVGFSFLLIVFILGFVRIRTIRIQKRACLLQSEIERQTRVIKDQMKVLAEQRDELETLAITDDLTKMFNRRYFFSTVNAEIKRHSRYRRHLSLVIFDVDHFKEINDTFGHDIGDKVLAKIAEIMKLSIRSSDVLARFGGEEFILLLPETDVETAFEVAERIRIQIEKNDFDGVLQGRIEAHVSAGISSLEFSSPMDDPSTMIRQADRALYKAKQSGRNRVIAFSSLQ